MTRASWPPDDGDAETQGQVLSFAASRERRSLGQIGHELGRGLPVNEERDGGELHPTPVAGEEPVARGTGRPQPVTGGLCSSTF
jgi:hypothetical protein